MMLRCLWAILVALSVCPAFAEDAGPLVKAAGSAHLQLGPMLGHVGPYEAHVWIKAAGEAKVSVAVWGQTHLLKGRVFKGPELGEYTDFMGRVAMTGLLPNTRYQYAVLLNKKPAMLAPYPEFTTGPADGEKTKTRFCFTSCNGKEGFLSAASWGDMAARAKFDLLLMLGDNHYADSTERGKQRTAYYDHRRISGFAEVVRRTPTYAIWDDHDYGPNDSDGTAPGKENSIETFRQFWANPAYGEADNPGCYFKLTRGDVDFFMLDGRYYRTPNKTPDDGTKTMLGSAQLAWLKRELLASKASVKFMAMGSEWQSFGTKDSWTSFARERGELFAFIEENKIGGVVLLSGDRHFTGAYQVQGKWIEITSGPLGSKNYPTKNLPEMFLNFGEGKLYCIVEADTTMDEPKLTLEIYRAGEGLIQKRPFSWSEITGAAKIAPLPPTILKEEMHKK